MTTERTRNIKFLYIRSSLFCTRICIRLNAQAYTWWLFNSHIQKSRGIKLSDRDGREIIILKSQEYLFEIIIYCE
jgi:hypothetical protein